MYSIYSYIDFHPKGRPAPKLFKAKGFFGRVKAHFTLLRMLREFKSAKKSESEAYKREAKFSFPAYE